MLASGLRSRSVCWLTGNIVKRRQSSSSGNSSVSAWQYTGVRSGVRGALYNIGGSGGVQGTAVEAASGRSGRRASSNNVDIFRDTATLRMPNGEKVRQRL